MNETFKSGTPPAGEGKDLSTEPPASENLVDQEHDIPDPREKYFMLMKEISTRTHTFIADRIGEFEHMKDYPRNAALLNEMLRLPEMRKGGGIMRSVLTELMYRNLGGKDTDITPALALSELNNYNGYLDNWILDNKKQVWATPDARQRISQITLASGVFRELIDMVTMELSTTDANKLRIIKILSQAMTRSYQGQEIDLQMAIEKISSYKNDGAYLRAYIRKSLLQSGYLYGASAEIGAVLADAPDDQAELAKKIGETMGTGLHMSNDLGDFAIMEDREGDFKDYQDQMADLKNGRLSLPIYYILKYGTAEEKTAIAKVAYNPGATIDDKIAVAQAIHSSGSFEYCKKLVRRYHNSTKGLIAKLPDNQSRSILSIVPVVIRSNKYLSALRKLAPVKKP